MANRKSGNVMASILNNNSDPSLRITLAAVVALALPAIIEQVMVTLVNYVDTAMVGSLGSVATASVGLTASTTWLLNGVLNAAAVGFSVQVAHMVGARNYKEAREITGQALKFVILGGLIMFLIAFGISFPLPTLLGASGDVKESASLYFRIYSFGVPFNFTVLMLSAIIRCSGDTKTPMFLNFGINILNVIFNFLFIYDTRELTLFGKSFTMWGLGLGVAGAALGSIMALFIIAMCYVLVIFRRETPVKLIKGENYSFRKTTLSSTLKIGLPVLFERTLMSFAQVVITSVITRIGTAAIAANHLAVSAESLSYLPANGVSTAGTTLIGQALGAGRKDLAKKFSRIVLIIGAVMMTGGGIMLYCLSENLIAIFSADPEVIKLGGSVLRIVAFAEPFFALSIVSNGILRGAGDTKGPFLISLITMWGVRITLAFALSGRFGLHGVWIAMAIELFARGMLYFIRVMRGKWMNFKVIK
ncbi:MAG: MATE family efflux transporter [Clostridia bacterium]|nr:MATE family efflux transporter [Clostridia bacterium]